MRIGKGNHSTWREQAPLHLSTAANYMISYGKTVCFELKLTQITTGLWNITCSYVEDQVPFCFCLNRMSYHVPLDYVGHDRILYLENRFAGQNYV
jgi:hypothetical protein